MSIKLKIGIGSLLLMLITAGVATSARAITFAGGDSPTVAKSNTINSTLYTAGSSVQVAGTVQGDVYCAGQTVDISGTVQGDVLCAAQTLTITGHVLGNIRVAGQTVNVSGAVDGSATIAAQTANISPDAKIGRDTTIYAQLASLDGTLGRDVVGAGTRFTINGPVGRDINVHIVDLTLGGSARIGGNLTYVSDNELHANTGATVIGSTQRTLPTHRQESMHTWQAVVAGSLFMFAASLATGILLLIIFPKSLETTAQDMRKRPWLALGLGLVVLAMPFFVALVLFMTIVGLPAAVVLLLAWIAAMLVALPYGAHALGRWLFGALKLTVRWPAFTALVSGLLIVAIAGMIPILGGLVCFAVFVWGLGGLMQRLVAQVQASHAKPATKKA